MLQCFNAFKQISDKAEVEIKLQKKMLKLRLSRLFKSRDRKTHTTFAPYSHRNSDNEQKLLFFVITCSPYLAIVMPRFLIFVSNNLLECDQLQGKILLKLRIDSRKRTRVKDWLWSTFSSNWTKDITIQCMQTQREFFG